ncbi:MAG: glycogen debranching enzyme, partial [Chloroflexota bacterium]|nr:glycogen debranching enzyme [Chloroflexota bacterium]
YAQDNEISWYDWAGADRDLLAFVTRLIAIRRDHPAFRRRHWFQDRPIHGTDAHEINWFAPDGTPMGDEHWHDPVEQGIGVYIAGTGLADMDGLPVEDDSFFLAFNPHPERRRFCVPAAGNGTTWQVCLDTAAAKPFPARGRRVEAGGTLSVAGQSMVLLQGRAT